MSNYVLSCCSTSDLTKEHFEKINVEYICFHYFLDGVQYDDDLGQTMPLSEFYQKMVNGADTATAQVNISEYLTFFTKFLEEGRDIIHITLSSGLSGSYNSARNAAAIAAERYPDRKIYVVDSLAASSGAGLMVDKLAELRDSGMSIDELYAWIEANKLKMHHWFFSTDLTFYIKGGRVSKTAGTIGGILGICPLLNMDNLGRLIPRAKVPGKKRVINEIVKRMEQHAEGGENYSGKCYISNSACYEDAKCVAEMVEKKFPKLNGKVEIYDIGTTIGSHTGPGTVALFFWGDERID
ncbi:MAG: DegV family protein [Oscillospiraceae bacterium]|nr:DegV family protein [Oscillospiraceae bacterium]MBQ9938895.1 DegV family protein [Oscillospiraceae bacterium]